MPINIDYYEKLYLSELGVALKEAKDLVETYENARASQHTCDSSCDANHTVQIKTDLTTTAKPGKLDRVHEMIQSILYSSGYYATITKKKLKTIGVSTKYDRTIRIIKMTPEEKERNHKTD